jgi:hypothetical protein
LVRSPLELSVGHLMQVQPACRASEAVVTALQSGAAMRFFHLAGILVEPSSQEESRYVP